jgi:multidrug transporter EmrE-like cation transporter
MSRTGWFLILLSAGLTVAANLLLRSGVERAGGFTMELASLAALARQLRFDLGIVLYAMASLVWFRVLSIEPLSIAYPVLVSSTFLLVTIGAVLLFHESLAWHKILGLVIILAGIFIISRS